MLRIKSKYNGGMGPFNKVHYENRFALSWEPNNARSTVLPFFELYPILTYFICWGNVCAAFG